MAWKLCGTPSKMEATSKNTCISSVSGVLALSTASFNRTCLILELDGTQDEQRRIIWRPAEVLARRLGL